MNTETKHCRVQTTKQCSLRWGKKARANLPCLVDGDIGLWQRSSGPRPIPRYGPGFGSKRGYDQGPELFLSGCRRSCAPVAEIKQNTVQYSASKQSQDYNQIEIIIHS